MYPKCRGGRAESGCPGLAGWLAGWTAGLLDCCQVVDEVQAGQSVPGGFDLDGGRRKKSIIGKRQSRRL